MVHRVIIFFLTAAVVGYRHDSKPAEIVKYENPFLDKDFHRPVFDDIGLDDMDLNFVIATFNRFTTWSPVMENMVLPPGVRGSTGTKRWKFVSVGGRWEKRWHRGQFSGNDCTRFNVTMNEHHRLLYYLPASPAFVLLKRTLVDKNGVEGTPAPVILSPWLYGSEWTVGDFYFTNDSYEGLRSVEVSLTALPFNTIRMVEEFLWSLMIQKSVSQLQLAAQLMKTKRVMQLIARHRQMTHWDSYWRLDIDAAIDQYIKYGKYAPAEPSYWPVVVVLFSVFLATFSGGYLAFFAWAYTSGRSTPNADSNVLYRTDRASEVDRQLLDTRRALDRMSDECSKLTGENLRLNQKFSTAIAELTRLRPLEGRLKDANDRADNYLRDVERCRNEMRDARNEANGIRTALVGAQAENDDLKRDLDLLTSTAESMANERRHLHVQLDAERAKNIDLSEQIRVLQDEGNADSLRFAPPPGFALSTAMPVDPTNTGPPNAIGLEDIMNAVYATLFSSPRGYDDMGHLLRDLSEDAAIDGDVMAGRFGYQNLGAFLRSSAMASKVIVTVNADGGTVYKARPNETNLHLHREQQTGFEYATNRRIKSAVNKAVARERAEKERLQRQLALTEESVEKFKSKLLKANCMQSSSRFQKSTPKEDQPTTSRASFTQAASIAISETDDDHSPRLTLRCTICFERPPPTATATIYKCGHCYCLQCIDDWRNPKAQLGREEVQARKFCPSCREPINDIIRIYGE